MILATEYKPEQSVQTVQQHQERKPATKDTYTAYINSGRWLTVRKRKFNQHGRFCDCCSRREGLLHVHHRVYPSYWGEEKLDELMVLCQQCHEELHKAILVLNLRLEDVNEHNVGDVLTKYTEEGGRRAWRKAHKQKVKTRKMAWRFERRNYKRAARRYFQSHPKRCPEDLKEIAAEINRMADAWLQHLATV